MSPSNSSRRVWQASYTIDEMTRIGLRITINSWQLNKRKSHSFVYCHGYKCSHIFRSAAAESRGIHSGKEHPAPKQPLNISEVLHLITLSLILLDIFAIAVVESSCNTLLKRLQASGQDPSCCRLCGCWVSFQVSRFVLPVKIEA